MIYQKDGRNLSISRHLRNANCKCFFSNKNVEALVYLDMFFDFIV